MGMTTLTSGLVVLAAVATVPVGPRPEQQGTPTQSPRSAQREGETLVGVYWKLVSVADVKAVAQPGGREPHIVFRTLDSVTGSDGCNTINGSYTRAGESLKLGPLMGTLRSCALPDSLDRRFREALMVTRAWKVAADELTLLDENGTVLARLERRVER
jgi:heat shock protein HslJ